MKVLFPAVVTPHTLQDGGRTRLQWKMNLVADVFHLGHHAQGALPELAWMR
jgi:hypothetical protein